MRHIVPTPGATHAPFARFAQRGHWNFSRSLRGPKPDWSHHANITLPPVGRSRTRQERSWKRLDAEAAMWYSLFSFVPGTAPAAAGLHELSALCGFSPAAYSMNVRIRGPAANPDDPPPGMRRSHDTQTQSSFDNSRRGTARLCAELHVCHDRSAVAGRPSVSSRNWRTPTQTYSST